MRRHKYIRYIYVFFYLYTHIIKSNKIYRKHKYSKVIKKLYINKATAIPNLITVEYIPKLKSVEDIKSDYWIDILIKYCVAMTKVVLGRIRTRFTQSNALWTQDGDKILEEGNTELKELREILRVNSNMVYILD
jgi:hypothetical protein